MYPHIWIPKPGLILPPPVRKRTAYRMSGLSGLSGISGVSAVFGGAAGGGGGSGPDATAPTAFYRLEDVTDSGPNTLNMTNNNTVTFVAGKVGNCGNFVSTSFQRLSHVNNALYQSGTGIAISIVAWVNLGTGTTDPMTIVAKWGGNNEYLFYVNSNYQSFAMNVSDGVHQAGAQRTGTTFSVGTWYFMACKYDPSLPVGSNIGVSLNGEAFTFPAQSGTNVSDIVATTQPFEIGGSNDFPFMRGKIDALGFWKNYALTNTEVASLYNGGTGAEYYSGAWHG